MSTAAVLALCLLAVTGAMSNEILAERNHLKIEPPGRKQKMPLGKSVLLSCITDVEDLNLVTDHEWRYPNGSKIPNVNNMSRRPAISSEYLASQHNLMLIISSLQEADAGEYVCAAMYGGAQELRQIVDIEPYMSITWLDAPLDQHPTAHQNYTVLCRVAAQPNPIVDWLKNDEMLTVGGNARYVVVTDGLFIRDITEADDGVYTCRAMVTERGELEHRFINVVVHTPPTFKEDMVTKWNIVAGEDANLVCQADGKPQPTYKWVQLPTHRDLTSSGRFSVDPNKGILNIKPVEKDDQGQYECIASNRAGDRERLVELNVIVPPHIDPINNISTPTDKTVQLDCVARGRPRPMVTFRKLSSESRYHIGAHAGGRITVANNVTTEGQDVTIGMLTIADIIRSDDGLYECIASNEGGTVTRNGHITVEFKPSFSNTPRSQVWGWDKNPVNLTCIAESIPNATITWKLNDANITGDPNIVQMNGAGVSSLLITPIGTHYYGSYTCTAHNIHGTDIHTIRLNEATVPSSVLQAKVDGYTATTITFSFYGPKNSGGLPTTAYAVKYKEERQTWDEAKFKSWVVDTPYVLENLEPQKRYLFRFAAQNDVGFGHWNAEIGHTMPKRSSPGEPIILNQIHDGVSVSPYATSFHLQWNTPPDNGERIDQYQIKICSMKKTGDRWEVKDDTCQIMEVSPDENPTSYDLSGLEPNTHYKVELRAHNIIGYSRPSKVTMKTVADPTSGNPGPDVPAEHAGDTILSSSTIIIIVVASLCVLLVIIDLLCFCFNRSGIIMAICEKTRRKPDSADIKLGSEEKQPLKDESRPLPPVIRTSVKRETSVDFDMKKSISRTSFVGKDSAV